MDIQFGVFDHMDRGGRAIAEVYAMRLALCEAYDDAGFRGYHVAEHHATTLGMSPSPGIFLAAVAQRTKRLRFGPAVYVLPAHEPLRLIEEICMLDQLSAGRFELGVGRGFSPFELAYFGVGHLQSRARFDEVLEIVKKGLTCEVLNHKGPRFEFNDVPMVLQPVQRPHPPIWQGVTRVEGAAQAAHNRVNMIMNGPVQRIRPATDRYRMEWRSVHGDAPPPMLGLTRHIHVADTDKEAEATARQAYAVWYQSNAELWRRYQTESLIFPKTYDEAMKNKVAIVGSPGTVRARIEEDMQGSGCNYFVGRYVFGDLGLPQALRSIELMKTEVMPQFVEAKAGVAYISGDVKHLALTGATLIDGNGGIPLADATLLMQGNRIKAVGPRASITLPPGTQSVDCRGKTVLPGLVDSHVHVGTSGGGLADPEEFKPATLAANLKTFLAFGVTSIMDMGGNPHLGKLAADLSSGALQGPRLFGARYGITAPGSHPMGLLRELRALDKIGSHFAEVDTPEAARALVQKVALEKPAGLKIYHSRTEFPGTMCLDCNREKLKPEVLKALVEEGHAQGLRIFAHIAWPSEAREVIEAGVDVLSHPITHAESGVEPVLEMIAARGARIQSTMTRIEAYFGLKAEPLLRDLLRGKVSDTVLNSYSLQNSVIRARHLAPGVTEDARRILEITMANLRRANRMGVEIVMGTDSGGPGGLHGAGVPREMELLNDCGLTPMQVIMAATKRAADVIGQGNQLGTLEAGKLADAIVIDGDPLRDINHIKRLVSVVRDGQLIDPNALEIN